MSSPTRPGDGGRDTGERPGPAGSGSGSHDGHQDDDPDEMDDGFEPV
jgi:hypothetical protein